MGGPQRPGADLTMWFVEQIAGLTQQDPTYQDVQATERYKKEVGPVEEGLTG